ncbi:uncharacterized protein LOC110114148 [Dendrobium catenatum]|uniref:uncharacterized protein LOC110114148 n=1 Tax=Dendrobium catenatum TaxID=906689 RepID=UPI0009F53E94|nr:uncharacterized protein LOC110114148 [Dendrobium catenatum]
MGIGWFLCSFFSEEMVEAVHSGGPWFLNGHIIGMEKWTPEFNTSSIKGLSSPIWIRMPHLPLQCWDEKNIACIASRIGKPLMMDGNMFHWARREFAIVCVRIKLDQPLPTRLWVDSIAGRFFKNVEYEKVSNFCFVCGKIDHANKECGQKENIPKILNVDNGGEIEKEVQIMLDADIRENFSLVNTGKPCIPYHDSNVYDNNNSGKIADNKLTVETHQVNMFSILQSVNEDRYEDVSIQNSMMSNEDGNEDGKLKIEAKTVNGTDEDVPVM